MTMSTVIGYAWSVAIDAWNAIVPVATLALAAATAFLAKTTSDTNRQADRHHQENARPFCWIEFDDANDLHPFGNQLTVRPRLPTDMGNVDNLEHAITILGTIHNAGKGPAKDLTLYLNKFSSLDGTEIWLTRPVVVAAMLGAEASCSITATILKQDVMHYVHDGHWKPTQLFDAIPSETYEVVLAYNDIFDNPFRTVHPLGFVEKPQPGIFADRKKQQTLATRQNKPTPVFLKGRQSWRTLADVADTLRVQNASGTNGTHLAENQRLTD